jgi:hypothetical protein
MLSPVYKILNNSKLSRHGLAEKGLKIKERGKIILNVKAIFADIALAKNSISDIIIALR